jgi:hypothetical protein
VTTVLKPIAALSGLLIALTLGTAAAQAGHPV